MFLLNILESGTNWQFGFQIAATPVMEGIVNFHHDLFFFLVVICIFVLYMLVRCIMLFNNKTVKEPIVVTHAPVLEIIWTIIPALILIAIAIPSFSLLYSIDEVIQTSFSFKVIGHQWYWSYEMVDPLYLLKGYGDLYKAFDEGSSFWNLVGLENLSSTDSKEFSNTVKDALDGTEKLFSYDSYMLPDDAVQYKHERLLRVDNSLYLPVKTKIRLLITSADVIHSWAVPALGIKLDACPGRLNQTSTFIKRPGNFYGQCSEICGVNHGFMPISVVALSIFGDKGHLIDDEYFAIMFNYFAKKRIG